MDLGGAVQDSALRTRWLEVGDNPMPDLWAVLGRHIRVHHDEGVRLARIRSKVDCWRGGHV